MKLVIDADMIAFKAAAIAQETSVDVVHKATGKIRNFKNRTEFYGHHSKKEGGFLGEFNSERIQKGREPISWEDFEYQDVVEPMPQAHALHICKTMMQNILDLTGVHSKAYHGYIGKGDSFRLELSTLLEYKGQRKSMLRPVHLDACKQYLIDRWRCKEAKGLEADDCVTMDQFAGYKTWKKSGLEKDKLVAISNDKDMNCTFGWMLNIDSMQEPKLVEGTGYLYDDSGEIRGFGTAFKAFQVLYGDDSDNYLAACASSTKWGKKSAFKLLKDCKTDKELWTKVQEGYKILYPEPKTVLGWRGKEIQIDYLYVLQEILNMQHMLRFEGDKIDAKQLLKGYELL